MRSLKIYYARSPIRCECFLAVGYILIYIAVCSIGKYTFYQSGTIMNVFAIIGYILGTQTMYQANKTNGCVYKFFRTMPDAEKKYRNAYILQTMIGMFRPAYLTVFTLVINVIPHLGNPAQNDLLLGNYFSTSFLIAGFAMITGKNMKEILVCVGIELIVMLVFMFNQEFLEEDIVGIVFTMIAIFAFTAGAMKYHLCSVKRLWNQGQEA